MKRYLTLCTFLALLLGLSALPVLAQTATVKGYAKDQAGKPIAGATVELLNNDTGLKTDLKTNDKGEFFSVGIRMGNNYTVTLIQNGKPIDGFNKVPIQGEQVINFDLAKDVKQGGVSEEQQKKIDEVNKANEKIKGLNAQLAQARDLEKAGNYDQAVQLLQQATQTDPTKDLIWAYLGDAYLKDKKYTEAAGAYQKALDIAPTKASYHAGLADAYGKSNPPQLDKAIAEYNAAAQAEPANAAMYYFNEGALLTNAGKVDDANAAFDKSIQADPKKAEAYYWKGVNMMGKATTAKDGKFVAPPGTAEAFKTYLDLKPDGPNAEAAKQMLASMEGQVETSFGKGKAAKNPPPKK